jgi:uncharacterized protein
MPDKEQASDQDETRRRHKPGPTPGTENAKHGGQAAVKKYGRDFFREIGKKGGTVNRNLHGTEFYARIGRLGGRATQAKHGAAHYARIGRIGGVHRHQRTEEA